MVQRSSTHIVAFRHADEIALGDLYSERAVRGGMTTAKADLIFASWPYRVMSENQKPLHNKIRETDEEFYKASKRRASSSTGARTSPASS